MPHVSGPVNFAFGKEALLALYTDIRPKRQPVVDYLFREANRRNAGVSTTSHVFAEVLGSIRSKRNVRTAIQFWNTVVESQMYVLHGAQPWNQTNSGSGEKAIANGVKKLYRTWESIEFKFHEGTLVLDAAKLNEERTAETTYVVSLDGKLTNLAWNEDVDVLPSRTPHRSDDIG